MTETISLLFDQMAINGGQFDFTLKIIDIACLKKQSMFVLQDRRVGRYVATDDRLTQRCDLSFEGFYDGMATFGAVDAPGGKEEIRLGLEVIAPEQPEWSLLPVLAQPTDPVDPRLHPPVQTDPDTPAGLLLSAPRILIQYLYNRLIF